MNFWQQHWNHSAWRDYLAHGSEADNSSIRRSTHTGRPLGSPEFVKALEKVMHRDLAAKKGGRPEKSSDDHNQSKFSFGR